jgi:hypothetical protein
MGMTLSVALPKSSETGGLFPSVGRISTYDTIVAREEASLASES